MKKPDYLKSFKGWFELNKHRFPYPTSILSYKKGLKLLVPDLSPLIEVHFFRNGVTLVTVNYNKEHWDVITDFTVNEAKDGKLYFCAACCDLKYFTTIDELYADHNFEPFLSWLLENLKTENWLHILEYQNVKFAKINTVSPNKLSKDYVFSTRLILDKNDACSE